MEVSKSPRGRRTGPLPPVAAAPLPVGGASVPLFGGGHFRFGRLAAFWEAALEEPAT